MVADTQAAEPIADTSENKEPVLDDGNPEKNTSDGDRVAEIFEAIMKKKKRDQVVSVFDDFQLFLEYIQKNKTNKAHALYSKPDNVIQVVFDYFEEDGQTPNAQCGKHVTTLKLQKSSGYLAWKDIHDQRLTQAILIDFLEKHGNALVTPSGTEFSEAINDIHAKKTNHYHFGYNLSDGTSSSHSSEEVEIEGLDIPSRIEVSLPIYENHDVPILFEASLRYRICDCGIDFWIIFNDFYKAERKVFQSLVETVRQSLS